MPTEPHCVLCGHGPHNNSTPDNPGGCMEIKQSGLRMQLCNCPEYRKPGVAPVKKTFPQEIGRSCINTPTLRRLLMECRFT